jgi:hypothetical protein
LQGEVAKGGGGDAGTSATTNDKEIARKPHPPDGLGRDGPISLLLLPADVADIDSSSRLDLGSVALPTNVAVFMKVSIKSRINSEQGL